MITPQPNDENASAANNLTSNNGLSFSWKQTFYHRFTRADLLLLKSPNKKIEVLRSLYDNMQIKNKLKRKLRKTL